MSFSATFIRRPVATVLLSLALTLFGVLAYLRLPVSALPNVDFPTIQISAGLPGASSETMAVSVATPLEREFSAIDGVTAMTSESSLGSTNVTLQFDPRRNIDSVAQDVQAAISRAAPRLPRDLPSPPSYRKVNPAEQAILILSLSSSTLPLHVVNEWAESRLAQALSTVRGVAQVQIYGPQKYAVRVQLDPEKLAARNVTLNETSAAIRSANVRLPTGTIAGTERAFSIRTNGQLEGADAYGAIVAAFRNGQPIRVSDLGRVLSSVENDKSAAWRANGSDLSRAIVLGVQKQPGANTVEVADEIRRLLPQFRTELPSGVALEVLLDRSVSVRDSVLDVQLTLLFTLALVVMVIFLFLRRWTATVIPSMAMPLAILATFSVMYLLGYSLNNLTLLALTLSVGFVVDDAIVVLENVVRHVEMGKPPLQAALEGTKEIGFTVVSMTLSLAAVFIPFLFLGGILGSLFREFAVTIAVAILVSGVVSLTLTPMMAARLLPPHVHTGPAVSTVTTRLASAIHGAYGRSLRLALRFHKSTFAVAIIVLAATVYLFRVMPKGFLPTEDIGQLQITTEAAEGIAFPAARERQQQVAALVQQHPAVEGFLSTVGARGTRGAANQGMLLVRLKPRSARKGSAAEVARQLQQTLAQVPGMRSFVQVPPPLRLGGRSSKSEYQFTLKGTDLSALQESAPRLAERLAQVPILKDVTLDLQLKNPEIQVQIDRERAATLGITPNDIEDTLYGAYGSRQISTMYTSSDSYAVILEVQPSAQVDPEQLGQLHLRGRSGELVPLASVATLRRTVGPTLVTHAGQLPSVTLSFNLAPGHSLSEAVALVEAEARVVLPPTISTQFQGTAEAFQSSLAGLGFLLLVSVFVIYLVLGILYESFLHPITILSALPFAGFGALATLLAFGNELDVYAFVGMILLVGLVKKNGIMMVDFAIEARRERQVDASEAIYEACLVRFRPIMMTTMAALLGTLPIALGYGAGAEARRPLGLAVVGGLLFSQLLTLYVTPVFYVYLDRFGSWLSQRRQAPT